MWTNGPRAGEASGNKHLTPMRLPYLDEEPEGADKLTYVMQASRILEHNSAVMLAYLVGIDRKKSKVLGQGSKAISLDSKVHFLMEVGKLKTDSYKLFQWFMEIRNQWAHNNTVTSMTNCLENTNVKASQLLKEFNAEGATEEDRLWRAFEMLAEKVNDLAYGVVDEVMNKKTAEYQLWADQQAMIKFREIGPKVHEDAKAAVRKAESVGHVISNDRIEKLIDGIMNHILVEIIKVYQEAPARYRKERGLGIFQFPEEPEPPATGQEAKP